MSGPQFVHIETYARSVSSLRRDREVARAEKGQVVDRKLTVEEICGEAARLPGHHPHVEHAKAPILLFGISPDQVPALLEERIAIANAEIKAKKAAMERGSRTGGPRAVRPDTHVLLTMVASHPIPWRRETTGEVPFDNPENRALLEKWVRLNIKWAKKKAKKLGFELVSVVRHDDEGHPHLHFIGIPKNQRVEARACHPGYAARDALKKNEGENDEQFRKRRNRVYKSVMRSFQDDYYKSVSVDSGLVRTGPKRRRVPGAVWHEEKAVARARGLAAVRADQLAQENEQSQRELGEVKDALATAEQDAVQAILQTTDFERERDAAEKALESKRAEAASLDVSAHDRDMLIAAIERENAALEKAKKDRQDLEDEIEAGRAEKARADLELKRQTDELAAAKRKFDEEKAKAKAELAERRQTLEAGRKELDAVMDGVVSYAEGKLRYIPDNPAHPFYLTMRRDGSDAELKARLEWVKPRLIPVIQQLDEALTERVTKLQKALTAAVAGWSTGLLEGVGEPRDDGRPTFLIPETAKGNRLLNAIEPFREAVAQVISALPDRGIVASVKAALARLQPRLAKAEQEEAQLLEAGFEYLNEKRIAER